MRLPLLLAGLALLAGCTRRDESDETLAARLDTLQLYKTISEAKVAEARQRLDSVSALIGGNYQDPRYTAAAKSWRAAVLGDDLSVRALSQFMQGQR